MEPSPRNNGPSSHAPGSGYLARSIFNAMTTSTVQITYLARDHWRAMVVRMSSGGRLYRLQAAVEHWLNQHGRLSAGRMMQ